MPTLSQTINMPFHSSAIHDLTGQIALVTGGGTGIGYMISTGLASNGAKVYITGRRVDVLEKVAREWKGTGSIVPLQMDVTSRESIAAGKKVIEDNDGKLHILVNNAGQVGPTSPFLSNPNAPEHKDAETLGTALFNNESFEGWASLYSINVSSIFFVSTAFLGLLDKGSRELEGYSASIVNLSSISAIIKLAQDHFCYNSSKAAVSHLTKMMATEFILKGVKVRVNAIAPGVYESEMTTTGVIGKEKTDAIGKGIQSVPEERAGTAQEMIGTVLYLVSRAGGYTNGQEIVIDGGYIAVNPSTV